METRKKERVRHQNSSFDEIDNQRATIVNQIRTESFGEVCKRCCKMNK